MYGPRHLLQLVAIKRLQARGLSLVAIQAELAGATDAQLARVAQVAEAAPPAAPTPPPGRPAATLRVAPAMARPPGQGEAPAATPTPAAVSAAGEGEAPTPTPTPATAPAAGEGEAPAATPTLAPGRRLERQARFWRERPAEAVDTAAGSSVATEAAGVVTLRGVRLGERATLLLDPARPLDDADLRAILDAARPLLEALRARGLDHPGREHQ